MHRVAPSFLKICRLRSADTCFLSPPLRQLSTESATQTTTTAPFASSFLINECGVHPELAASALKHFGFETPDRANAVLAFLRNLGCRIPKMIGRLPRLLNSDPVKQFVPKIGFLESNGFSAPEIAQIIGGAPGILHSSIERRLLPNLNFLKDALGSEVKAIHAVRRCPTLLTCDPETYLIPSIKLLRESGVGESSIVFLLHDCATTLMTPQSQLSEVVERVKEMGMDPKLMIFGVAIRTIRSMTRETWESKTDAYKKWGWSEEDTRRAFTKFPWCMKYSVKKIMETMDYYVNEMGFDAVGIANYPPLLGFSLKKRIVPRDAVLSILVSKGLIKSRRSVKALVVSNKLFKEKFLEPYKEEAPELLELFQKEMSENETPGGGKQSVKKLTIEVGSLMLDSEKED